MEMQPLKGINSLQKTGKNLPIYDEIFTFRFSEVNEILFEKIACAFGDSVLYYSLKNLAGRNSGIYCRSEL